MSSERKNVWTFFKIWNILEPGCMMSLYYMIPISQFFALSKGGFSWWWCGMIQTLMLALEKDAESIQAGERLQANLQEQIDKLQKELTSSTQQVWSAPCTFPFFVTIKTWYYLSELRMQKWWVQLSSLILELTWNSMGLFVGSLSSMIIHWLFCMSIIFSLLIEHAWMLCLNWMERKQFGSLSAKLMLAPPGMPKWGWPWINR